MMEASDLNTALWVGNTLGVVGMLGLWSWARRLGGSDTRPPEEVFLEKLVHDFETLGSDEQPFPSYPGEPSGPAFALYESLRVTNEVTSSGDQSLKQIATAFHRIVGAGESSEEPGLDSQAAGHALYGLISPMVRQIFEGLLEDLSYQFIQSYIDAAKAKDPLSTDHLAALFKEAEGVIDQAFSGGADAVPYLRRFKHHCLESLNYEYQVLERTI